MDRQEFLKNQKLVSKVEDIIKDIKNGHFSDAVIHSKMLVDYLVFAALKHSNASNALKYGKNVSDEERMGYLLDKGLIAESVFDNCLITKGVRNPTIHGFTYPNKNFAIGSVEAAISLYYHLQVDLELPQMDSLDDFISADVKVESPVMLVPAAKKLLDRDEYKVVQDIVQKFSGPNPCIITFPDGTRFKNGELTPGVQMNEKVKYAKELTIELQALGFINKVEWSKVDIYPPYPNLKEYFEKFHPKK